MNDINCWQPQIMKTLCGHLALFEAHTHTHTHATDSCMCVCVCVVLFFFFYNFFFFSLWVTFFSCPSSSCAQSLLQFENDIRSPLSEHKCNNNNSTTTTTIAIATTTIIGVGVANASNPV